LRLEIAVALCFDRPMAVIRSLTPSTQDVRRHRTEADATFQVLEDPAGRLFQLSTYGSDSRASQPKVSQTIQLDRERAAVLVKELRVAFPGI
jgi:hypothetical protein